MNTATQLFSPSDLIKCPQLRIVRERSASLTEYEVTGLKAKFNFADGHAYHEMPAQLTSVANDLQGVWRYANSRSIPEIEEEFKLAFAECLDSLALHEHAHFSILPTASNSIDAVAAWLASQKYRVGLIEPTFDNLHLILKRRAVEVYALQEELLVDLDILERLIDSKHLGCIFLVSPNNPTGFTLTSTLLTRVAQLCARKKVVLILDRTFRFYSKLDVDDYGILTSTGVDFIVIEDTGKTWPTQDLKVSLLAYSSSIAEALRTIYEEIFLCSSNFTVALLARLVSATAHYGLEEVIWKDVQRRRNLMLDALSGSCLNPLIPNGNAILPFIWVDCTSSGRSDVELVQALSGYGIAVLPGRNFYWNSKEQHTTNLRLSLMRPNVMFCEGLKVLKEASSAILKRDGRVGVQSIGSCERGIIC